MREALADFYILRSRHFGLASSIINMVTVRRRWILFTVLHLSLALLETSALRGKRDTEAPLYHVTQNNEPPTARDEYIVRLRDDLSAEEIEELEKHIESLMSDKEEGIQYHETLKNILKGFTAKVPADALNKIRWLEEVEYVEEDGEMQLDFKVPWNLDRIDQENLPLDSSFMPPLGDGTGVNVFVVDSGILYSHLEFNAERVKPFFDTFDDGRNGEDCHGHGTHVAGIIAGSTVGIAPGVTLYSARTFDCDGKGGTTSRIVSALDAITDANLPQSIVSMSFTGGKSVTMNEAIERMAEKGYIVIAAAGNEHKDACLNSPASATSAITVGATTQNDSFADFSNFGSCVNIQAPGKGILSAHCQSPNSYTKKDGTSMATPHVSGVAARLLEYDPEITRDGILTELVDAAGKNLIDMSVIPEEYRSDTPNYLLRVPSGYKTWRDDLRCGAGYLNKYNEPAECDPYSDNPCCGADNFCGSQPDDCTCATCADYRPDLCYNTCWWNGDGECDDGGPGASYNGCDYGTDCKDCGPRPPL
ncbi:extracellular serine proteinase-like isoform X3 [Ptychodera flava]|uniref:extracellular serine proteinase-like isoform X3 n=1 Tax=Ptychodera flava TaxID=63121 RepID=UPI00396A4F40